MADGQLDRRLLAILIADVVGYSGLMETDEPGTIARLKAVRIEVVNPSIERHHGHVIKLMGDGALVTFESVVDAVSCAVDLQRVLSARNAALPETERIVFRFGVNLGNVALVDGDVYGDGVNVAARLEHLAEPGGIIVSGTAYDQLQGKLDVVLEFIGEQQVKNIARTVRAYRVRFDATHARRAAVRHRLSRRALGLGAIAVLAIAAAIIWWQLSGGPTTVQGESVVAVLPFDNLSGDPADKRLADAITTEIITDLSRYPEFAVIAKESTAVYKDKPVDVRQIGKDLNVSHVLGGSFQREGGQIRITAQLIDTATGTHVWSERYDRPAGEVFAIQSEVVDRIANSLGGPVGPVAGSLLTAAKRKQPGDLSAYELLVLGFDKVVNGLTLESQLEATKLLEQAIQIDPGLARAHQALAWSYSFRAFLEPDFSGIMKKMMAAARRAVELDPLDYGAQMALGFALVWTGDLKQGEIYLNEALRLNPNAFDILSGYGCSAALFGKAQAGVESVERAIRLNPNFPAHAVPCMRFAFAVVGRYEDALRVQEHEPEDQMHALGHVIIAGSLAKLGRLDEAKALAARGIAKFPGILTLEQYVWEQPPIMRPFWEDMMRTAGFPVCADEKDVARYPNAVRLPECTKKTQ